MSKGAAVSDDATSSRNTPSSSSSSSSSSFPTTVLITACYAALLASQPAHAATTIEQRRRLSQQRAAAAASPLASPLAPPPASPPSGGASPRRRTCDYDDGGQDGAPPIDIRDGGVTATFMKYSEQRCPGVLWSGPGRKDAIRAIRRDLLAQGVDLVRDFRRHTRRRPDSTPGSNDEYNNEYNDEYNDDYDDDYDGDFDDGYSEDAWMNDHARGEGETEEGGGGATSEEEKYANAVLSDLLHGSFIKDLPPPPPQQTWEHTKGELLVARPTSRRRAHGGSHDGSYRSGDEGRGHNDHNNHNNHIVDSLLDRGVVVIDGVFGGGIAAACLEEVQYFSRHVRSPLDVSNAPSHPPSHLPSRTPSHRPSHRSSHTSPPGDAAFTAGVRGREPLFAPARTHVAEHIKPRAGGKGLLGVITMVRNEENLARAEVDLEATGRVQPCKQRPCGSRRVRMGGRIGGGGGGFPHRGARSEDW